ncbi:hypothetical protein ACFWB0_05830 [Rhodococcus sp. NPDC060086]|uniref:hypothetical protein n=1 Tax=Rhodococcus sp. NPDC060086 TaxID=3347055 RepID=UPI003665AB6C
MKTGFTTRLVWLLAASMLTGCTSTPTDSDRKSPSENSRTTETFTSGSYTVPENRRTSTIIWSAEPGIDLFGNKATLARAAIEADAIALANPITASYPGFARTIDQETKDQYLEFPATHHIEVGTGYFHIMRIEPTDTGFIAHTCYQTSNIAVKNIDARYSRTVTTGHSNLKFVFERTPTDDASLAATSPTEPTSTPPIDSTGQPQWQAPTYDVFAGWNINIDGSSGRDHTQACRQWGHQYAPDAIENEHFILTTDTPPDTLPAYPGW